MQFSEFTQIKDEFLTHIKVERNLASHTLRAYESDLEQFEEFWQTLNTNDKREQPLRLVLERFFVSLYHKQINKTSIARKISCFKSFEKFARARGHDLSLKLARPRIEKKLPVYLSVDEIFHLLDSVSDKDLPSKRPCRDKAIFELLYATGIRCAELTAITMGDLDLNNKTVRIFGKGRKERMALFGQKAKNKIIEYLKKERPVPASTTERLFLNQRNQPLTTRSIQRIFEMFRTFLKIDRPITPHKIRHSFATHLLNQGVDLRIVQELLGHATLSSTEKYTHVSSAKLAQMCDTLHPLNSMVKNKKR